jgi:hypothetical protein
MKYHIENSHITETKTTELLQSLNGTYSEMSLIMRSLQKKMHEMNAYPPTYYNTETTEQLWTDIVKRIDAFFQPLVANAYNKATGKHRL